ncbi:MAG: hypothetical protein R6W82_04700 [bacterium]
MSTERPVYSAAAPWLYLLLSLVPASPASAQGPASPAGLPQWRLLLHAHAQTGPDGELDERWEAGIGDLQRAAALEGYDAILFTEHLVAEWEWSPPLIRTFWRYRHSRPSVSRLGTRRYFDTLAAADELVPAVTLIGGVEVAPYYRWTGSPLGGSLVMRDWQRNLLVTALADPPSYRGLPVLGLHRKATATPGGWIWLLLLIALSAGTLTALNHLRWRLTVAGLAGVLLMLWSGPPPSTPWSPYGPDPGWAPWQAVIDSVRSAGGLVLWTGVESRDDQRVSGVRILTREHPGALVGTRGWNGFGALYPEGLQAYRPGSWWDRALADYLRGGREVPPWGWGELVLHYPSQLRIKALDQVQTVLLAPDRSAPELLGALRHGRGYALWSTQEGVRMVLEEFRVRAGAGEATHGGRLPGGLPVTVRVSWGWEGGGDQPVTLRLIRDGRVAEERSGLAPGDLVFDLPGQKDPSCLRLEMRSRDHILLSNPVFLR